METIGQSGWRSAKAAAKFFFPAGFIVGCSANMRQPGDELVVRIIVLTILWGLIGMIGGFVWGAVRALFSRKEDHRP